MATTDTTRLKRVILDRCVPALSNALPIVQTAVPNFSKAYRFRKEIQEHLRFMQLGQASEDQLEITYHIALLCGGLYTHEERRMKRLGELLHGIADRCDELLKESKKDTGGEHLKMNERLQSAFMLLRAAVEDFDATVARVSKVLGVPREEGEEDIAALLQESSLYEWKRDIPWLKAGMSAEELRWLSMSPLDVEFDRIPTSELCHYEGEITHWHERRSYSGVNAVYQSPDFEH